MDLTEEQQSTIRSSIPSHERQGRILAALARHLYERGKIDLTEAVIGGTRAGRKGGS
jgi:hypothetical protein